ncbi:MAG: hypothetical protein DRJ03_28095 [Chloroflexi bacterium]|nr:MAG: hypothetical protein DRJ03_28095 [Chloroflexota bacterium]
MPKWTTIRIPVELKDKIEELSRKRNQAYWKIIQEAIAWYQSNVLETRNRELIPDIDKVSWYIIKLSYSVSKFKDKPDQENYQWLEKTILQIKERLGVNIDYLLKSARSYQLEQTKENLIELWMSWKMAVIDMFYHAYLKKQ